MRAGFEHPGGYWRTVLILLVWKDEGVERAAAQAGVWAALAGAGGV